MKTSKMDPISVSQLTALLKDIMEDIPPIWLSGEITNLTLARSGHCYFSLKDANSQIRVNLWRNTLTRLDFRPQEGSNVLIYGSLNLYVPRGEYSLVVQYMEPLGRGSHRAAFEHLRKQLQEEGLFDSDRKTGLPFLPKTIGIVTSAHGAALQDIRKVLAQRFSSLTLLVADSQVQGAGAGKSLARAIQRLDGRCEVIILGRGGGSEQDLWAFNDETLVRAIAACQTPLVSAVGHESDITLSDLAADVRAATPSQAAELVVGTRRSYLDLVATQVERLKTRMERLILLKRDALTKLHFRETLLKSTRELVDRRHRLEKATERLHLSADQALNQRSDQVRFLTASLSISSLKDSTRNSRNHVTALQNSLVSSFRADLARRSAQIGTLSAELEALSPLNVLSRGYSILTTTEGQLVSRADQVRPGDLLTATLAQGTIKLIVQIQKSEE